MAGLNLYCAKCAAPSRVIDCRDSANNSIRRRRECVECGYRFSTTEEIKVFRRGNFSKADDLPADGYTDAMARSFVQQQLSSTAKNISLHVGELNARLQSGDFLGAKLSALTLENLCNVVVRHATELI